MRLTGMTRNYLIILFLAFSNLIYLLPYLYKIFYIQFQNTYHLTNIQIGALISYYAMTSLPSYVLGGWIADHFSAKRLVVLSCILTGIMGLLFSMTSTYGLLILIFLCFGLTTSLLYWSTYYKLVKTLGNKDEQGRIFGFNEAAMGIANLVASYGILAAMTKLAMGFRQVVLIFSLALILLGVLILLFLKEKGGIHNNANEMDIKLIPKVLSMPITWINAFIMMGIYMMISCACYFNLYLAQAFMLSAAMATGLQILYSSAARIVLSPLGGLIRDKVGSSAPMLVVGLSAAAFLGIGFQFIPQNPAYLFLLIVLSLLFCICIYLINSSSFTILAEAKVPIKMTGTMWGIISAVAFSSDLWLFQICGMWLDTLGKAGYYRIFLLMAGGALLALTATVFLIIYLRKKVNQENVISTKMVI